LYNFLNKSNKNKTGCQVHKPAQNFTNVYEDFLKTFFHVHTRGEKKESLASGIDIVFSKSMRDRTKIKEKRADPFKVMEAEFLDLTRKGIKPVLSSMNSSLDKIYLDDGKDRLLITHCLIFLSHDKESHLAHIIIASSTATF